MSGPNGPTPPRRSAPGRRAVVLGGGLIGMVAAAVLTEVADEVVIVERDTLPAGPEPRKSLPQARHAHLLWSGGARAFESLLPGLTEQWLAAGARRISLPTGLVSMSAQGWLRRWPEMQFMIACTRDLLDWVIRERVLALPGITLLERHEPLALIGDADAVSGVRISGPDGERALDAELVVDATGRGSHAPKWLRALGIGAIEEATVDSGLVYATRLFRAPEGTDGFPIVNVQADPRVPVPGQTATLVPVEGNRWLVTLSGTRGGEPSREVAAFEQFARSVRHPVVGDLISGATPLSQDVSLSRSTVNRRRYFERAKRWPEGFIAVGDAVATYNPVYGQGMSVGAQGLVALRTELRRRGLGATGLARRAQRAIARPASVAWQLATSQDILYPDAIGAPPPAAMKLMNRYVDRFMRTATTRPLATRALLDVLTLSSPATVWLHPDVALAVARGPRRPPVTEPPFTEAELALLHAVAGRSMARG